MLSDKTGDRHSSRGNFYDVDCDSDPRNYYVFRSLRQGYADQERRGDGRPLQPSHGREHQLRRSGVRGKDQIKYIILSFTELFPRS